MTSELRGRKPRAGYPAVTNNSLHDVWQALLSLCVCTVLSVGSNLNSILVRRTKLWDSKAGVLSSLPLQMLPPELGAAAMIAQDHLPAALQLLRAGHCLGLYQQKTHHILGPVSTEDR